jgi:ADP-ribosyl-[dinitrogen reductase] hydrolase
MLPLHIDTVTLPGAGAIGMTHCPGRTRTDVQGQLVIRNLADDVQTIRIAGFSTVLTLLPTHELQVLGAGDLGTHVQQAGMRWLQFPIQDFGVPDAARQQVWAALEAGLLAQLSSGEHVLVHCAAGLGRTGTMVAKLLVAMGVEGEAAIALVRTARPGTIETEVQRAFVLAR